MSNTEEQAIDPAQQTADAQTAEAHFNGHAMPQQNAQTYRQIAAASIDRLSGINEQLPKLLAYFAAAISQLTNNPIETKAQAGKPDSVKARQDALWIMSLYVGAAVKEIREELEKQINDLERYGVIPASYPRYHVPLAGPGQTQSVKKDPQASVKNGGYGDFDIGVLNARAAAGRVDGEDGLERLKTMVDELVKRSKGESCEDDMAVDG